MPIPNLANALIERDKIVKYLLSDENSDGKAAFFVAFGFTIEAWEKLRDALINHATSHEVFRTSETPHGTKFVVEGEIATPDGRKPLIRSVWIIDNNKDYPRLVTAYPLKGAEK